jgi:uncharacterized membrane protein
LGIVHRIWFVALVTLQLVFLLVMPVFSGNDERGHMDRMWAIAEGHFFCKTLPQAVRDVDVMRIRHDQVGPYWRRGLALTGGAQRVDGWSYACHYFPLGLVLPAVASRVVALHGDGTPRQGGMFLSTYAARVVSLAIVDVGLVIFLVLVPWGRSTALALFSNPMMIEQSVSFGHDNTLFCLCLLILALVFTRRDWRAVGLISLFAALMAVIKPIFIGFGMLSLPMIVQLVPSWRALDWKHRLLSLSCLAPFPAYGLWAALGEVGRRLWRPSFVHPSDQVLYLLHHPLHIFTVMVGYVHYFIDDHKLVDFVPRRINGEWTTLFFANLWLEIPKIGAAMAALGIVLAMVADATSVPHPATASEPPSRRERLARIVALLGVAAAIPATILALYITYTPVGANGPYAVQGRYHACALLSLSLIAVYRFKQKWPIRWRAGILISIAAAALMFAAGRYAITTIWSYYWG